MVNCLNVVLMVLLVCVMVGAVDAGLCLDMIPKNDQFLLTGTDLRLNCSLNRSETDQMCVDMMADFDVHNLSMKKGSFALPTDLYTYHEADDTLELTVPNVTIADQGTYSCLYGNSTIYSFKVVHIGEPPGEPENLTCVSNNFENLICSFSLNKKPVNIPTVWTMEVKRKNGTWTSLPKSDCDSSVTTCWLDNKSQPTRTFLPAAEYHIRVVVWNRLGKAVSSVVIINSTSIAQLLKNKEGYCSCTGVSVGLGVRISIGVGSGEGSIIHLTLADIALKLTILVYHQDLSQFTRGVKPNPLDKLGYNTTNMRGTVELHWDGPSGLVYDGELNYPLEYKIILRSEWDTRIEYINNTKNEAGESYRTYNLTHLIPFTKYSVTVQAKLTVAVGSIYWSDPIQINFNTSNEVSEHAVEVTSGSYALLEYDENVHIVLYWKNPDRKYWYGPITGYRILIWKMLEDNNYDPTGHIDKRNIENEPKYVSVAKPLSENISGLAVTGCLQTVMSKEESLKVQIMLINSEGVSSNFSEILIPNWSTGQRMIPKWVSVEMMESRLNISWHMDPDYCEAVTSVTYYWCPADPSSSQNVTCRGDFEWVTVNLTNGCRQETDYQLATQYNQTNVKYAVSLNTNEQLSGGMKWENYRFKFDAVPEKPEYTVSVDGTTMKVLVKYRPYHLSEGGRPILYNVVYKECIEDSDCQSGDSKSKSENFSADFSNPWYIISNLKLGSKYQVYVQAINRIGSSIAGDPQIIPVPKDDSSSLAVILVAVFGSLGAVAVGAVIVILIKRRARKYKLDFKITIPDDYQPVEERGFYNETEKAVANKSVDHDSGKGSYSPGSSLGQLNPKHKENGVQISQTSQLRSAGSDMVERVCNGDCSSSTLPGYLSVSKQDSFPDQGEITDSEIDFIIEDSPVTRQGYKKQSILNLDIVKDSGQNVEEKEEKNLQIDSAEYSIAVLGKDKDEHTNDVFVNEASVDSSTKDTQAVLNDLHLNNSNNQNDSKQSSPELNIEGSEVNDKSDKVNACATFLSDEDDDDDFENLEMSHYKNPDEVSLNGSTCSEDSVEGSYDSEEETNMNAQTSCNSKVSIVQSAVSDSFLGKHSDDDRVKDTNSVIDTVNISLDSIEMKKLNESGQSGMSSLECKSDIVSLESYMKTGFETVPNEVLENGKEGDKVDRKHLLEKNKRREVNGIVKRSNDENRENTRVSDIGF